MIARIIPLLPSLLILAGFILIFKKIRSTVLKNGKGRENIFEKYGEPELAKVFDSSLFDASPINLIHGRVYMPILEELLFRAPLMLLFGSVSWYAWIGILISAVIFGCAHAFGIKRTETIEAFKLVDAEKRGKSPLKDGDDPTAYIKVRVKSITRQKVVFAFLAGIALGVCAISYQSLWLIVGAHIFWNIIMHGPIKLIRSFMIKSV